MLTAIFLQKQFIVLKPISDRHRFDLVINRGLGFERVQCKSGRLIKGCIIFATCSTMNPGKGSNGIWRKDYRGQIELFGVYCKDNNTCYLVPVNDVGTAEGKLRIEQPKNKQVAGIRMASDYLI